MSTNPFLQKKGLNPKKKKKRKNKKEKEKMIVYSLFRENTTITLLI